MAVAGLSCFSEELKRQESWLMESDVKILVATDDQLACFKCIWAPARLTRLGLSAHELQRGSDEEKRNTAVHVLVRLPDERSSSVLGFSVERFPHDANKVHRPHLEHENLVNDVAASLFSEDSRAAALSSGNREDVAAAALHHTPVSCAACTFAIATRKGARRCLIS